MSSTTNEDSPRLPPPRFLRSPGSITGRLTLLYIGSTAALLLLAAAFLYWGLSVSLARQDHALVSGKLQVLRLLLREHQDKPDALASEIEHEASANAVLRYYLRVLDEQGRVRIETSGMSSFLPALVFPEPGAAWNGAPRVTAWTSPSGRHYLLLSGFAATGPTAAEHRILQVAIDVAHNEIILADYRWKLLVALIIGLLLAATAGVLVTRTGLRPIASLARATHSITVSRLGERLEPADWSVELRDYAAAFNGMLDRLQDSFRRLETFSSDLAHALRNPINNLRGEAEVALTRVRTPEEYRLTLSSALEEFQRLSRLIEGLLFIARTDNPQTTLERVAFEVRREMDAVRDFYEALAGEHRVLVTCQGEAWLTGNPMLVRRAISNLLANALKHTPAGGAVTMTVGARPDASVEICVRDTGRGVTAEHLPHVFERFYQADRSQDSAAQGAGLGLAIVQGIMRLHGGTASIASTPGQGTSVTLLFPPTGPGGQS